MSRNGIVAVWVLAAACASGSAREPVVEDVELRLGPGSAEPNLFATSDGRVVLTWHERVAERRHALRVAQRERGRWSEPRTIAEGDGFFVNWADFPSLVELTDGSWIVHWLQKSGPGTYAYHVALTRSVDRGASWGPALTPHRDRSDTEHGFVSMVPWERGAALVWLDGRAMVGEERREKGEGHDMPQGDMSIRFTTVGTGGKLGEELVIDDRTCECCQTALARTASGLVAAYRDRSEGEIRDIAVATYVGGKWSAPRHVASDHWHFPACPVNGPALSARGDTVAIAWFTAPGGEHRVSAAFSTDGGATWTAPIRVHDKRPLGRVDVELLSGDAALVSWLETGAEQAEIRARQVERGGRVGKSRLVARTDAARASGFPRMARAGDEVVFAWTETGEAGGVRVASLRYSP